MAKRKKRLIKQEKGFLKQAEKHKLKLKTEKGNKDTTHDYWKDEIKRYEEFAREKAEKLVGKEIIIKHCSKTIALGKNLTIFVKFPN